MLSVIIVVGILVAAGCALYLMYADDPTVEKF